MLEKPDLPDERLIHHLRTAYGLSITDVAFLPLGADVNTAVYRAGSSGNDDYFVKLRSGEFNDAPILVPRFLSQAGVTGIIPPIPTVREDLWTRLDAYTVVVYPFIAGEDGFVRPLSESHWVDLGTALRQMHDTKLPVELSSRLPRETFDDRFRRQVAGFQRKVERESYADPAASRLAELMRNHRDTISAILERSSQLGEKLSLQTHEMVVCHGDIHAGNVLIPDDESLFIVDWDTLIMAPRERDLMYVGAGIGLVWNEPEESTLFYRGYGSTALDREMLAYYRHERIVQDISEFCEQLLLSDEGGDDREQAVRYFESQFIPGSVVEMAFRSDS